MSPFHGWLYGSGQNFCPSVWPGIRPLDFQWSGLFVGPLHVDLNILKYSDDLLVHLSE